jgi:outer membrane receptor for ferrienterochelin and colicins
MTRSSYIKFILVLFFNATTLGLYSQSVSGIVYTQDDQTTKSPLPGVNVYWLKTTKGTLTDANGKFEIAKKGKEKEQLVFSFLGYKPDTITITQSVKNLEVTLHPTSQQLNAVTIHNKDAGSYISTINTRKVQVITTGELYRAACCNLAESFETNASVDVSYSDAITGAKQIQMLGLSGLYSQIISENVPLVKGLGASFGLTYIPGSWMEAIQVSKGTSSVINGYESITGQINIEYKKPATSEKLFVNIFANEKQRLEANINTAYKFNSRLSTMILGHVDGFDRKIDYNHDNFLDIPRVKTLNLFNRWDYINANHLVSRFGVKLLSESRNGGTLSFSKSGFSEDTTGISSTVKPDLNYKPYGISINTQRYEAFWKNGILFKNKPWKSVALIVSGIYHDQSGQFGLNTYAGLEKSFYANMLYQSIFKNENHKFTTGLSYSNSDYQENYLRTNFIYLYQLNGGSTLTDLFTLKDFYKLDYQMDRSESVYGIFFEYTLHYRDKLSVIAGMRADHHNRYGTFYTPRLNIKYKWSESLTLRGSAGKGYRTANVFAENYAIMASQRLLIFSNEPLKQEEAWNYGINLTKDFTLWSRKAQFDIEFYRTDFVNQVIIDMDSLPESVFFYNLKGESYSNSFQTQVSVEPFNRLTVLLAYRFNDVKTTIAGKLREKPFTSRYKGLMTTSYSTKFDKWKFDLTLQLNGPVRIPDQQKMPDVLRRDYDHSKAWVNVLAQVTKKFKNWDFYLGGENLANFTQKDPITEAFAPYHTHFDTSMVWGPLTGASVYAGLRYSIK